MKPIFTTNRRTARFPVIEFNYQTVRLDAYRSRCAKPAARSFRNISRQYFQTEARRDFVGEAILFAMLIITAAVPVVSGASAVAELCRAFGGF